MRRTWIKLYVDQCLRGSMISELTAEQRWMWIGLLLLAGDSSIPGLIFRRKDANGLPVGYSEVTLAETLDIDPEVFHDGIQRMIAKGKITVEKDCITILNWNKYQSEYERQRAHRHPDFLALRDKVKERDEYRCQKCGKIEDDLEVPLCVHHIDGDPSNNEIDNLQTLCLPCHSGIKRRLKKPTELSTELKCCGDRDIDRDIDRDKKSHGQTDPPKEGQFDRAFEDFWTLYPRKIHKQDARGKFISLAKRGKADEVMAGLRGYLQYLKAQSVEEERTLDELLPFIKHPSTFLTKEKYKDYIGFKRKPKL